MCRLVGRNLVEILVENGVEACVGEVSLRVVAQSLTVEFVLKMLEGQRIIEDQAVCDFWCCRANLFQAEDKSVMDWGYAYEGHVLRHRWLRSSIGSGSQSCGGECELHDDCDTFLIERKKNGQLMAI